jgi:CrcB protein
MVYELVFVGAGGFLGAIARFLSYKATELLVVDSLFPYATLFVNLTGCLIIGFVAFAIEKYGILENNFRFFIVAGFLGSFTTFSTFGLESCKLIRTGYSLLSFVNIAVSIIAGLGLVFVGRTMAKLIFS